jgi:phage gp36-like protein
MGYATIQDLQQSGLPPGALGSVPLTTQQAALDNASSEVDGYLGDSYTLPLQTPYPRILVQQVCAIASWHLLCLRGFNPTNAGDAVVRQRWVDAQAWLVRVANKQVSLRVAQGSPPSVQPDISSNLPRGYGGGPGSDEPIVGPGNWGD